MHQENADNSTHKDVEALNLQILLVARSVARQSPAEAHLRFGLEPGEVQLLAGADVEGLRRLAGQGRATFRPMFSARDLLAVAA